MITPVKDADPGEAIDAAIADMMRSLKGEPTEMKLKIIGTAIAWEKVKNHINEGTVPPLDSNTF